MNLEGGEGMAVEKISISNEDLEMINKMSLKEFGKDDVFVFRFVACDNQIDRDHERFDDSVLSQMAKRYVGTTMLKDHQPRADNQVARIYRAETKSGDNIAAVLRGDTKSQLESLSMGVSNGVYTPNEARRNLDLPSKPGGDRIYFNGSNIAVEDTGIQYEKAPEKEFETMCKAVIKAAEDSFLPLAKHLESAIININKYSDSQPRDDHGRWTDGGGGDSSSSGGGSGERENTARHSTGKKYSVDWKYVNSDEYAEKFNKLSDNEKVCQAIRTRAKWALNNRDGTDTEELYAIDLSTGKEIGRIANQNLSKGVAREKSFDDKLSAADNSGKKILLIHNHPSGMPPSVGDVNELVKNKNVIGITVGHDGSIYKYTKPNRMVDERDWDISMAQYNKFSEKTAQERTMQNLADKYGFTVEQL